MYGKTVDVTMHAAESTPHVCGGDPVQELLTAALEAIRRRMGTRYWNEFQREFRTSLDDPFANTGAEWQNDVFRVKAYDWGEEGNTVSNFKWKDVSVWWYKYLGRGMEWEVDDGSPLTPDKINEMLNDCMRSLPL